MTDDKNADWQSEAMHQNKLLHDALTRAEDLNAKLAKAVAALREIKSIECIHCTDLFNELADAVLNDIERKTK